MCGSWQYFYYQAHPLPNLYICYYPGYCPNTHENKGFEGSIESEILYRAGGIVLATIPWGAEMDVAGAIVICAVGGVAGAIGCVWQVSVSGEFSFS